MKKKYIYIFTSRNASELLGLSLNTMREYANRYKRGVKEAGNWKFSEEDIAFFRTRLGKRGRPPKNK